VNNSEDTLDIMQEVIYKALISVKNLKSPEYFNTWLTRITINCSINYLKKAKKVISIDDLKKVYEDIEIPANLSEFVNISLEKGRRRIKKEKIKNTWIKGFAALCGCFYYIYY
jgi:DNA-directed RNA polymerase specialized sigma24 family protein